MGHHHGSQWLDSWCGRAGWVIEGPVWLFGTAQHLIISWECVLLFHTSCLGLGIIIVKKIIKDCDRQGRQPSLPALTLEREHSFPSSLVAERALVFWARRNVEFLGFLRLISHPIVLEVGRATLDLPQGRSETHPTVKSPLLGLSLSVVSGYGKWKLVRISVKRLTGKHCCSIL